MNFYKFNDDYIYLQPYCYRLLLLGTYELITYGMKKGGPVVWEEKLKSSLLAHARLGYTDLVGVWYTDIGDHNDGMFVLENVAR